MNTHLMPHEDQKVLSAGKKRTKEEWEGLVCICRKEEKFLPNNRECNRGRNAVQTGSPGWTARRLEDCARMEGLLPGENP